MWATFFLTIDVYRVKKANHILTFEFGVLVVCLSGIRSSLSGLRSNGHEYVPGDPLSGDAIRNIILEKKPVQKDKPRRLAPIKQQNGKSQSDSTDGEATKKGMKNFQNLLSSAYGF